MTPPRPAPSSTPPDGRARYRAMAAVVAGSAGPRTGSAARSGSRQAGCSGLGTVPSMVARRSRSTSMRGIEPKQADRIGMLRIGEQVVDVGALDDAAGIHHQHLVGDLGDDAEIMGDDQDRHAEPLLQVAQEVEDLGLDGDVERRGRLVGDQQRRLADQRHRDHHALAHAARHVVRKIVDALRRRGDPHQVEHLDRARSRGARRHRAVGQDRLDDLLADGVDRIERGHRLLEDHRHLAAAQPAALVGRKPQHVAIAEQHRLGLDLARRARHQAHHRERRHALAAAGLADKADRASAGNAEADAVDGAEQAAIRREVGLQPTNLEERVHQNE